MDNLSINQLILLTLKAVHNSSKRARDLSTEQFEKVRNELRKEAFIWYSMGDKQWYLNERGIKLMKQMEQRVAKEICGN
jgi:hypothetical protein